MSLLSLVTFVVMALVLGGAVHERIESRAIAHDGQAVEFLAERLSAGVATPSMLRRLDRTAQRELTMFVGYDHHGPEYGLVRVFGEAGRPLSRAWVGELRAVDDVDRTSVRAALGGTVVRSAHREDGDIVLRFFVPITAGAGGPTVGVLAVSQDATAVLAEIESLSRTINLIVFGGLAVLWLVLLPIVARASRRLRRHAQVQEHQATHDELTGLPNRRALFARLSGATPGPDEVLGLAILGLDSFKAYNTMRGHNHGDQLLARVADCISRNAPSSAYVARAGGDEFAVLISGADAESVMADAVQIGEAVTGLSSDDRRLSTSGGVAILGQDADTADQLVEHASAAMAAAKGQRGRVLRYEPAHDALQLSLDRQREEIQALLAQPDRLTPVFQPIVELATGRLVGYEALTRVAGGVTRAPEHWFAQAHRCGLGAELEALAIRRALDVPGRPDGVYLALNLGPSALRSKPVKASLPEDLRGIVIEITEHELVADFNDLRPRLQALRARGARIAVDDAGAGYAGLGHLMRIRPDLIKLDRALIEGIDADPAKAALAECMVRFACSSGAGLCAEGIETLDELRTVADIDVPTGQGYVIARPAAVWGGVSPEAAATCHLALAEALAGGGTTQITDGLPLFEAISRRLSNAQDLHEVCGVTNDVRIGIGADEVALSLWDRDSDTVVTLSTDSWSPTGEAFPLSDYPLTRDVLKDQRALAVRRDDPGADPNEVALLEIAGHRSLLMIPIVARGRTLGVLEVYARDDRPWSRSDIRRLRFVCNQLGPIIESHSRVVI